MQLWSVCVSASPHYRKFGLCIGSDSGWWSLMNEGRIGVAHKKKSLNEIQTQILKETLNPFLPASICCFSLFFFFFFAFFLSWNTVAHRARIHLLKAEWPLEPGLSFWMCTTWRGRVTITLLPQRPDLGLSGDSQEFWNWEFGSKWQRLNSQACKRGVIIQVWYS